MSAVCGPAAEAVTRKLGFDCHDVSPVVSVRFPWELANWTMPLLEVLVIVGAVAALRHAVRRHREGDPVNLALWCASLVYLFVIEPPLYFPEWFGLDRMFGFIFAHNEFTVQFMWDRLPRAGPGLARRRLDRLGALEIPGPRTERATVDLRPFVPCRLPCRNGRVLDRRAAGILRR